jgi:curved DNA-binding protein CbpA
MATMAGPDPYKLLQVDPEADVEIIQVAYRKLAQRYHPDVAPGADAARLMAELNAARDLLVDPAARAAHDSARKSGSTAPDPASGRSPSAGTAQARDGSASAPRADDSAATRFAPRTGQAGHAAGGVLAFGRYAGWSLAEVARADLEYVEWLDRMPIGRPHRDEIDAILRRAGRRGGTARPEETRGLFRRR